MYFCQWILLPYPENGYITQELTNSLLDSYYRENLSASKKEGEIWVTRFLICHFINIIHHCHFMLLKLLFNNPSNWIPGEDGAIWCVPLRCVVAHTVFQPLDQHYHQNHHQSLPPKKKTKTNYLFENEKWAPALKTSHGLHLELRELKDLHPIISTDKNQNPLGRLKKKCKRRLQS